MRNGKYRYIPVLHCVFLPTIFVFSVFYHTSIKGINTEIPNTSERRNGMHTTKKIEPIIQITVDLDTLALMLGCGKVTAREIGECAAAKVVIGRRVLYSVDKVKAYVNALAE